MERSVKTVWIGGPPYAIPPPPPRKEQRGKRILTPDVVVDMLVKHPGCFVDELHKMYPQHLYNSLNNAMARMKALGLAYSEDLIVETPVTGRRYHKFKWYPTQKAETK